MIPVKDWKWFGSAGHFICSCDCRFHLATLVGDILVSTVGQYFPDAPVREIIAKSRGITLMGMGDARRNDYMEKIGFEEIGYGRKYETMTFEISGNFCSAKDCGCGMPEIIPSEIESAGYNTAGEAAISHMKICRKVAAGKAKG